jgi:flagellar biosynthesis protein FliR
MMIMPGFGDSFVPANIRLYIALGLTLVLSPLMMPYMPTPVPAMATFLSLIIMEGVVGLLIGTVARIFMAALDTAGMIISNMSGLANAQVFNPAMATQGSLVGAFLSVTGVLFLMAANLHHMLIYALVQSYQMFPVGGVPDAGGMAEIITRAVSASFLVGFQISMPFVVLALMLNVLMGVLSRLMPQLQVFMLAMPAQILLTLLVLSVALSAMYLFWAGQFEAGMSAFLNSSGGR